MKKYITLSFVLLALLQVAFSLSSAAQCIDGNAPTPVIMDKTIQFDAGEISKNVKFPQFDPEKGMLRCVKLTVTMTGIADNVWMQNLSFTQQSGEFNYKRNDLMTGPGLLTPLSNIYNSTYGPYSLSAFDGNITDGTDSYTISNDTVLHTSITRTLTDSVEISQFYGHDSVTFFYNIDVTSYTTFTGGNCISSVATSAFVNFKFEYCTCPKVTLPIGLNNFNVTKTSEKTASLTWQGQNDEYAYTYDVEMSRDGKEFTRIAVVDRQYTANPQYQYAFTVPGNDYGRYYFRVRQHWVNGYVRYTPVKPVDFVNPLFASISLYPNPASSGQAGLKFVNAKGGKMLVLVSNAAGQRLARKELNVAPTDYHLLPVLPAGMYWVKITDMASGASCVKQLVVQ